MVRQCLATATPAQMGPRGILLAGRWTIGRRSRRLRPPICGAQKKRILLLPLSHQAAQTAWLLTLRRLSAQALSPCRTPIVSTASPAGGIHALLLVGGSKSPNSMLLAATSRAPTRSQALLRRLILIVRGPSACALNLNPRPPLRHLSMLMLIARCLFTVAALRQMAARAEESTRASVSRGAEVSRALWDLRELEPVPTPSLPMQLPPPRCAPIPLLPALLRDGQGLPPLPT